MDDTGELKKLREVKREELPFIFFSDALQRLIEYYPEYNKLAQRTAFSIVIFLFVFLVNTLLFLMLPISLEIRMLIFLFIILASLIPILI